MPRILITGTSRGLGLEFARQYAERDWEVLATCRSPDAADELTALTEKYPKVSVQSLDVTDESQLKKLADDLGDEPLDALLNNAGIIGPVPIAEHAHRQRFGNLEYPVFEEVMKTNTWAPVKLTELLTNNLASASGKVLNISSGVGSIGTMSVEALAYAASKSALNRVMTIIAGKLKEQGVSVGLYCPGYVKTRMDAWGLATVEISDSVTALIELFDEQSLENTGQYRGHDGRVIPW